MNRMLLGTTLAAIITFASTYSYAEEHGTVVIVARVPDRAVARLTSELEAMGLTVHTSLAPSGSDVTAKEIRDSAKASGSEMVVHVAGDRIEIWSSRGGAQITYEEGITRGASEEDDADASTQSAERVRARIRFFHPTYGAPPDASPAAQRTGAIEVGAIAGLLVASNMLADDSADSSIVTGGRVEGRLGYRLQSGWGMALAGGFTSLAQSNRARDVIATPIGFEANRGKSNDAALASGAHIGGVVSYQRGDRLKGSVALGGGVFLAQWRLQRDATLATAGQPGIAGIQYEVSGLAERGSQTIPYVSPEVRVSYEVTPGVAIEGGIAGVALFGMNAAKWEGGTAFHAGECPNMDATRCQGLARLEPETVFSKVILSGGPFLGARASF